MEYTNVKGQCENCGHAFKGKLAGTDLDQIICPNCSHLTSNFDEASEVDALNKANEHGDIEYIEAGELFHTDPRPALYIKVGDGQGREVKPANGKTFTYDELRTFIGGAPKLVEIVPLPDGRVLVGDEEAKLTDDYKINQLATAIWRKVYPIEKYPHNNDEHIAGDVLICPVSLLEQ